MHTITVASYIHQPSGRYAEMVAYQTVKQIAVCVYLDADSTMDHSPGWIRYVPGWKTATVLADHWDKRLQGQYGMERVA